ncbi:uncharacterized protein LOC143881537 [Tasmannia lanceolata]|uniref:uncharacterized protein LOC143881537 n=1 Tax=Tasmannia lanceolata TaxID=3420 RepID=UPI004062FB76
MESTTCKKVSTQDWVSRAFYSDPTNSNYLSNSASASHFQYLKTSSWKKKKMQWRPVSENRKESTKQWVSQTFYSNPGKSNKSNPPSSVASDPIYPLPNDDPNSSDKRPILSYAQALKKNQTNGYQEKMEVQMIAPNIPPPTVSIYRSEPAIYFDDAFINANAEQFKYCLVGKFPRSWPSLTQIRDWVNKQWKLKGSCSVTFLDSQYVFIRLDNVSDMLYIWKRGTWFVNGHLMKVFKWNPHFHPAEGEPSSAAVWITLPSLPVVLFQEDALISIASLVGRALAIDAPTRILSQTDVARVCVEIDLLKEQPRRVWIGMGQGGFWQGIHYERLPSYCLNCSMRGHSTRICRYSKSNIITGDSQQKMAKSSVRNSNFKGKEDGHCQDQCGISKGSVPNSLEGGSTPAKSARISSEVQHKDVTNQHIIEASSQLSSTRVTFVEAVSNIEVSSQLPSHRVTIVEAISKSLGYIENGKSRKDEGNPRYGAMFTHSLIMNEACLRGCEEHRQVATTSRKQTLDERNEIEVEIFQQDQQEQEQPPEEVPRFFTRIFTQIMNKNNKKNQGKITPNRRKFLSGKPFFFWKKKTIVLLKPSILHTLSFSLAEIERVTKDFDVVIGVGGFGIVFKGVFDGRTVAVKRLNISSQQGFHEFQAEIKILSRLRHRNLVSLIGYCEEKDEMILVYEYMAHGSLREHLYGSDKHPLSWKQRLEICIGAARGLHYLHCCAPLPIIHRDVKTTNILLDEEWAAKISDFGLSRVGQIHDLTHITTVVKGTLGYLDPDYFRRNILTVKSDIYSFGVVLFEVLCARPPTCPKLPEEQICLSEWAIDCRRKGILEDIIDPSLKGMISPKCLTKFAETAEKCVSDHGIDRPTILEVMNNLKFALQLQEISEGWETDHGETIKSSALSSDSNFSAHNTNISI